MKTQTEPRVYADSFHESIGLNLVAKSEVMQKLLADVERIANSELPVLITGPTGSGKEIITHLIHRLGSPPDSPFIDINCSAIPENLIESQLFGHEKGAFTGAASKQEGYFSLAGNGVLFLDEIAELPLWQQARLLRVLETRQYRPVGGAVNFHFPGRVIAATHVDLDKRVKDKRFREDLFYRLNIVQIRVPSLHERREDIPLLVEHFSKCQKRPIYFTPKALKQMEWANWNGNIRELKNTVDRIAVMSDSDCIDEEEVKLFLVKDKNNEHLINQLNSLLSRLLKLDIDNKLVIFEHATIMLALKNTGGNKSAAARTLGVHRKYIERRIKVFEDTINDVYALREQAMVKMAASEYKKATKDLRLAIKNVDCCLSFDGYDELKLDLILKLSVCLRNLYGWNHSEVVRLYDEAQNISSKTDISEKLNSMRFGLWVNQLVELRLEEALATSAANWQEGEQLNNPNIIAQAALSMANTQFWLGEYQHCNANLQKFIHLYTHEQQDVIDFGHDPFVYYLMFKSLLSFQQGKVSKAIETFQQLMCYVREINQPFSYATALQTGAWLYYKLGDFRQCYQFAKELKMVSEDNEFKFFMGMAEIFMGHKIGIEGGYKQARKMIMSGFIEKLNGNKGLLFNSMKGILLADIAIINQQFEQGLEDIQQTIKVSLECHESCYYSEQLLMRGRLKMFMGEDNDAYQDFKLAHHEALLRSSKAAELKVSRFIAKYHYRHQRISEVKKVLTPVVLRFVEQSRYLDLVAAQSLLSRINEEGMEFH